MTKKHSKEVMPLFFVVLLLSVACHVSFAEQQEVMTSEKAFVYVETMPTLVEKANYLVSQAKLFLEKDNYIEAKEIARYILDNLDPASKEAQDILREANVGINEDTLSKVNPVKIKF